MKTILTSIKTAPLKTALLLATVLYATAGLIWTIFGAASHNRTNFDEVIRDNSSSMMAAGRQTFRFDTFGDEAFWGDTLQLHLAIEGENFGGVGPGLSPNAALSLGLKVDVGMLPPRIINQLRHNQLDLNDPAVTLLLLRQNAVVGLSGSFNQDGSLRSVGISCSLCHATVDNSLAFGIGHQLDGWANRDLNVGAITALSPNLQPVADLLGIDVETVITVLNIWGPGKFDAALFLDGRAFNPEQITDGVVTGTNVPGAVLIPNALGLAGYNQHTWTGGWGTVTYWNALVANIEMHGVGTFFDPRLNDPVKYPVAARAGFGNIRTDPDSDRITSKLGALQFYQLAIPAPQPTPGVDFDSDAAARGHALFRDRAQCNTCHVEPLWTEPGWNLHSPEEMGIDAFQANRAPNNAYKTMNLAGIFVREEGRFMDPANAGQFYHDGRFQTLLDVVNHYNILFDLGLTDSEKSDLIEYLKSL